MLKNWTSRDWFWLLGILISIIILLIASIFAKSKSIELNFSIISSAVSIALALVAIFFAWKQDSDNQVVTRETSKLLSIITTKIESMDNKIDKLDPNALIKPEKNQLIDDIEKIIKSKEQDFNPQMIEDINKTINEKFNVINNKLQNYYQPNSTHKYKAMYHLDSQSNVKEFLYELMEKFDMQSIKHNIEGNVLSVDLILDQNVSFEPLSKLGGKHGLTMYGFGEIN